MVTGKPFSTLADAEAACNTMFGELEDLTAGFVSVCHFRDPIFARRKRGPAFRPGHGMVNRAQSVVAMRRWGPPAIVMLVAMAALMALTADAAARQARRTAEATAQRKAGEPIIAIVSIKSQQVTFYDADGWILRAP